MKEKTAKQCLNLKGQKITCGFNDTATQTEKNFTSPNWPLSYTNLLRCRWLITTDSDSRIEINFENIQLENHYDSLTFKSGNYSRRLTGSPCLRPYISHTSSVSISFFTDSTVIGRGFFATYKKTSVFPEATSPNTALCGFNAQATIVPQQLNSPNWPNPFRANQQCMWLITAPAEKTINITFYSFAISEQHDLEILDGGNRHLYQSSMCFPPFISTTNVVQLILNVDGIVPSYSGFQLIFQETNECVRVNGVACPSNSNCASINGTYQCVCWNGYTGNDCADIDECTEGIHDCHDFANCTNTEGSFTCACREGFEANGSECIDYDECVQDENLCDLNAICINTNGSFACQCISGYTGNGFFCEDTNECNSSNPYCDPNGICTNAIGAFECECMEGFVGNGFLCTDVDECSENENLCPENNNCINTNGSYHCACLDGYTGDGMTCTDINECANDNPPCDYNADCVNSEGSFQCSCLQGFTGNGLSCSDIDECANDPTLCHSSINCMNTEGSYECACPEGYTGDETNCEDIDECTSEFSPCHRRATCTNTDGSFTCTCLEGYTGNGIVCTDPNALIYFVTTTTNSPPTNSSATNQPTTTSHFAAAGSPFCSPQTAISKSNLRQYTFRAAPVYSRSFSAELCASTDQPLASIRCEPSGRRTQGAGSDGGVFDIASFQELECGTSLRNVVRSSSPSQLPSKLEALTAQPEQLTEEEVTTATEILSNLQEELQDEDVSADILSNVANTIANLAAAIDMLPPNSARTIATKSKLLSTLNELAASVHIPENSPNGLVEVRTADVNLQAVRITPTTIVVSGRNTTSYPEYTFDLNYGNGEGSTDVVVSPGALAEIARSSDSNSIILQATVVGNRLSPTSSENASQIVTVAARNAVLLTKSISITYNNVEIPIPEEKTLNPLKRILNKAEVSEWDYDNLQWNPANQCDQDHPERPEYLCKGLASYAVLFSSKEVPSILALSTVSICGSILSIVFLSATIFVHIRHSEIRKKPTTMSLINICLCLIGVYFFYVVGVGRAATKKVCDAMTFMLHYFTLASISWMTVNAAQMYRAFMKYSYSTSLSKTFVYVLSYGLPLLLVLINFLVTVYHLDLNNNPQDPFFESLYRYRHVCWLQAPSLIWGFFLPLGVLVLGNYVIFVLLLKKVVFRKRKVQSTAKSLHITDRLLNAVTMVTMMGLTWIFGYLLLISEDVTYQSIMQWLFAMTNIFQGVVIFYLYCIRRDNMRRVWLPRGITLRSVLFSSSVQNDTPSATNGTYKKRFSTTSKLGNSKI